MYTLTYCYEEEVHISWVQTADYKPCEVEEVYSCDSKKSSPLHRTGHVGYSLEMAISKVLR